MTYVKLSGWPRQRVIFLKGFNPLVSQTRVLLKFKLKFELMGLTSKVVSHEIFKKKVFFLYIFHTVIKKSEFDNYKSSRI